MIVKFKKRDLQNGKYADESNQASSENVYDIMPITIIDNVVDFKEFKDNVQFYMYTKEEKDMISVQKDTLDYFFVMNDQGQTIERIK